MIKILDLFSGTQSVKKALNEIGMEYEYYGIDIYNPKGVEDNIILDLTQEDIVNKVLEVLPKGWKPDFIWASPVCNKFSMATTGKGGNSYFIVDKEKGEIRPRTYNEYAIVKHNKMNEKPHRWNEYINDANLALKMFSNMKLILKHYNAPFVIENPKGALSKYILKECVANFTDYCMWDNSFSKKPTTIYSNRKIDLRKCNHKGKHNIDLEYSISKYDMRSRVPKWLIIDILEKVLLD